MSISQNYPNISPSLSLDFANVKKLDPRVTFSRPTVGRFYDGKTVAKAEENLLLRSQEFNVTTNGWAKPNATISANSTTAPDGTSTAETVTPNSQTREQYLCGVNQGVNIVSGNVYTFSCYVKANGYDFVCLLGTSSQFRATFDLAGLTATNYGASATLAITDAGNSWRRIVLTYTATATAGISVYISPCTTQSDPVSSATFDGTSGIYIWGAQLEQRSSVTAYTPTTTQPITNYIPVLQTAPANVARFDHNPVTGESLGLMVEELRTNLLLQSEDLDTTWSKTRATLSLNSRVSPNGTLTSDILIASTDNDTHFVAQTFTGTAAAHTFTVYAKASGLNHVALRLFNGTSQVGLAYYNLSTGATGTVTAGTASITSVGNGWYRCGLTATLAASASCTADIYLANADNTNSFAGNAFDGVSLWGAQLEAGAFPTSYVKTEASQVTRSADSASMTGANFSSWFNIAEGSVYVEAQPASRADFNNTSMTGTLLTAASFGDALANQFSILSRNEATTRFDKAAMYFRSPSQAINFDGLPNGTYPNNVSTKFATGFKPNDYAYVAGGGVVVSDTSPQTVIGTQLNIGANYQGAQLNGTIKKLAYYPARLSNTELQALTS